MYAENNAKRTKGVPIDRSLGSPFFVSSILLSPSVTTSFPHRVFSAFLQRNFPRHRERKNELSHYFQFQTRTLATPPPSKLAFPFDPTFNLNSLDMLPNLAKPFDPRAEVFHWFFSLGSFGCQTPDSRRSSSG